ncbi:hypothetical protein [Tenacibaculum jejuense]|uniref:Uncharacterized protein n=1 Tax=Tenacibaculum jejuense TaxID=584609 RepID=A0A238UB56_9FLAO|nr:hypothetical protein [Tenacibaculum jejuense]SNR16216.1 Protein of unknown function [Tenacibaculum jejuense]
MKQFYLTILLLSSVQIYALKDSVSVVDLNFRIPLMSDYKLLYGFAEGDKIIINYKEERNKKLKTFEVGEYKGSTLYSDFNMITLTNKVITIKKTGIYIFKFSNLSLGKRVCSFKLDRVPASENTIAFDTTVKERVVADTTYTTRRETYIKKEKYIVKKIHENQHFYVNSGSNAFFKGGKSRIALPLYLPKNTVKWYYTVVAFRDKAKVETMKQQIHLTSELTKLIDTSGGLGFLVNQLTLPPGRDYCGVYLINHNNLNNFFNKKTYSYYPSGTRENIVAANVEVPNTFSEQMYLAILNPSRTYGVNVLLSVSAIVLERELEERTIKDPHINYRKELYLDN